jgi:hypothetical protein
LFVEVVEIVETRLNNLNMLNNLNFFSLAGSVSQQPSVIMLFFLFWKEKARAEKIWSARRAL